MASQIDPSVPVTGTPTTQSVRSNFATAQTEISALQERTDGAPFLRLAGGRMNGPMYLFNDPTDSMMPATKGYVDARGGGDGGGGGGIPEAPATGEIFGRGAGAWQEVLPIVGGVLEGPLLLADDPDDPLGAATKQYVDAVEVIARGALPIIGGVLEGPLLLADDPTDPLGAVTKRYTDTGLALRAPIANPTFTGPVNASGNRLIVTGTSAPSLTLRDTTATQQTYGIYHANNLLNFGLTDATGAPSGGAFATMDSTGAFLFATRLTVTSGRLISRLNGNSPALALHNQSQSNVFGMWNDGTLRFGLTDAQGVPQNALVTFPANGAILASAYAGLEGAGAVIQTTNGSVVTFNFQTFPSNQCIGWAFDSNIVRSSITNNNCPQLGWEGGGSPTGIVLAGNDNQGNGYQVFADVVSDERIKENIVPTTVDALAVINAVPVSQFDIKPDAAAWLNPECTDRHVPIGLVAQHLRRLIPEAVNVQRNPYKPDNSPLPDDLHTVVQQQTVPYLIRAFQQLLARVVALEAR